MTRRDRIVLLLVFFNDVREGFNDPPNGGGDGASRFSGTWSSPEYVQLRTLLSEMRNLSPLAYRNVTGFYMASKLVRRARCPRCRGSFPASVESRSQHCDGDQHGRRYGRAVTMEPYMQRVTPEWVIQRMVNLGVDWLEQQWVGECDLPREIRDVLHTRQVESLKRGTAMERWWRDAHSERDM